MTPDQIAERHTLSHVKHEWPDSGSIYVCTCGEEFDQLNFHARHIADAMLAGVLGPAEPLAEWERELLSPFPAGLTVSEDGVALNWRGVNYVRMEEPWPTAQWVWHAGRLWEACNDNGTPYYTNAAGDIRDYPAHVFDGPTIPVRPVPVAAFDVLVEKVRSLASTDQQWRAVVARAAELLVDATEDLGPDE